KAAADDADADPGARAGRPVAELRHARRRPTGSVAGCPDPEISARRQDLAAGDRPTAVPQPAFPVLLFPARSASRAGRGGGELWTRAHRGSTPPRPRGADDGGVDGGAADCGAAGTRRRAARRCDAPADAGLRRRALSADSAASQKDCAVLDDDGEGAQRLITWKAQGLAAADVETSPVQRAEDGMAFQPAF